MRKSVIKYLSKPSKGIEESNIDISQYENDRLETQQTPIDTIVINRSSQVNLKQKENKVKNEISIIESFIILINTPKKPEVCLRKQKLMKIPQSMFYSRKEIGVLDLRQNKIIEFPKEILILNNLSILRLDCNYIKEIPHCINQLAKLQILTLGKNAIRHLDSICELKKLVTLIVNDNCLQAWPNCIYSLLKLLHIQGNDDVNSIPIVLKDIDLLELGFDWLPYIMKDGSKVTTNKAILNNIKSICEQANNEHIQFKDFIACFNNKQYSKERSVLHMASMLNHIEIIKQSFHLDVNKKDKFGMTPLILAIKQGNFRVVDLLLSHPGIRVSESKAQYGTALHLAINKGYWTLCNKLIDHHTFDVNAIDNYGNTALHSLFANFSRNTNFVSNLCRKILSRADCNPNQTNYNGMSPIHYAAYKEQKEAIEFALEMNKSNYDCFDLSIRIEGQTLLHLLALYLNAEAISLILPFSIDGLATDIKGKTARQLATSAIAKKLLMKYEIRAIKSKMSKYNKSSSTKYRDLSSVMKSNEGERLKIKGRCNNNAKYPRVHIEIDDLSSSECSLLRSYSTTQNPYKTQVFTQSTYRIKPHRIIGISHPYGLKSIERMKRVSELDNKLNGNIIRALPKYLKLRYLYWIFKNGDLESGSLLFCNEGSYLEGDLIHLNTQSYQRNPKSYVRIYEQYELVNSLENKRHSNSLINSKSILQKLKENKKSNSKSIPSMLMRKTLNYFIK